MSFTLVLAAGVIMAALAVAYWDRIKRWLDDIVANKLEKIFGYGARQRLHHAVSIADRVVGGIRNRVFIYVKRANGAGYEKMQEKIIQDFDIAGEDIVKEISEKGPVIQEFTYTE
ncbi:hypothetical protein [Pseudobutyrivibrio xylanivorans]|uniref:Uncharacterized protein n=1 Tax=Pseudobutyrivibrio xylanivorans TaxID=185007 RepID=A0A5P6VPF9_PSEXY|nr:hypothetical protein [Pseudobutyrivibrio xylanivorans]QFJ54340.1 hypothetical protein FXF36_05465 [Pseudobutyrivibrio xylanivorans]